MDRAARQGAKVLLRLECKLGVEQFAPRRIEEGADPGCGVVSPCGSTRILEATFERQPRQVHLRQGGTDLSAMRGAWCHHRLARQAGHECGRFAVQVTEEFIPLIGDRRRAEIGRAHV